MLIPLLVDYCGFLHCGLLSEYANHKIDDLVEGENFILLHELAILKHLNIENVVDKANEQVYLRNDNHDDAALGLVEDAS